MENQEKDFVLPSQIFNSTKNLPSGQNFVFKPKLFPNISNSVRYVKWNSVDKKIFVAINETPEFEVYKWIEYIEKQSHEIQKSPFSDLDSNCLTLIFLDENHNALSAAKFKNLTVTFHECKLSKENDEFNPCPFLIQVFTLTYQYCEFVYPKNEQPEINLPTPAKKIDEEWQIDKK